MEKKTLNTPTAAYSRLENKFGALFTPTKPTVTFAETSIKPSTTITRNNDLPLVEQDEVIITPSSVERGRSLSAYILAPATFEEPEDAEELGASSIEEQF